MATIPTTNGSAALGTTVPGAVAANTGTPAGVVPTTAVGRAVAPGHHDTRITRLTRRFNKFAGRRLLNTGSRFNHTGEKTIVRRGRKLWLVFLDALKIPASLLCIAIIVVSTKASLDALGWPGYSRSAIYALLWSTATLPTAVATLMWLMIQGCFNCGNFARGPVREVRTSMLCWALFMRVCLMLLAAFSASLVWSTPIVNGRDHVGRRSLEGLQKALLAMLCTLAAIFGLHALESIRLVARAYTRNRQLGRNGGVENGAGGMLGQGLANAYPVVPLQAQGLRAPVPAQTASPPTDILAPAHTTAALTPAA